MEKRSLDPTELMIRDYQLSFRQIPDPRIWKPVLWASLLSLGAIFLVLLAGGAYLYKFADSFSHHLDGWMSWADGWIQTISVMIGTLFLGILSYFFLSSVYAAFLGLFLDRALDAVREVHYPGSNWENPPGMIESTIASFRFILWSLVVYLLASPLLLVAYFIPPLGLVLQILLGGYLLGREFGQLVELRMPKNQRLIKPGRLAHGVIASLLWMFPLINLFAPMLLATALVHHRLGRQAKNPSEV